MQFLRPIASHAHEPTYSMGDDTALTPLAGRARPLYPYFKPAIRPGHEPADRPPPRAVRDVRCGRCSVAARRSCRRAPRSLGDGARAASSSSPTRSSELQAVRLDATFDPPEALEAACERLAATPRRPSAPAPAAARLRQRRAGSAPIPALLADRSRASPPGRRASCGRRPRSSSRRTRPARCITSPACSATAPRPSARGSRSRRFAAMAAADKIGGDRPSPAEAQLRFKQAIEDGVLKVMSKMGISDVASYCGAQIFDALGLAREVVDRAFVGTPSPDRRHRLRRARARDPRAVRGGDGAKPALENPGYVKWRKGGEPHETNGDVVDALHELAAAHALQKAVRNGNGRIRRLGALRAVRRARQRARRRSSCATCSSSSRAATGGPARRGRARRARSSAGSPAARCRTARSRRRRTRRSRSRSTASAARSNCGEGGEDPARFRRRAQLADQAGRVRPLRRHARVPGVRRRAPDQDRAGLQARRGRPAARPQGHGRDRAAPAHASRAWR